MRKCSRCDYLVKDTVKGTPKACRALCKDSKLLDYLEFTHEEMRNIIYLGCSPKWCPFNSGENQTAKADQGKARLTLVPRKILYDVARIREYGNRKYGDPDNWKTVEPWRYRDAMMRHMCAYLDDPKSVDEESGLPHLWHLACNVAFLCEMEDFEEGKKA